MTRKRRWIWIVLFIVVVLLLGSLATGWNVVLVQDYRRLLELARSFALHDAESKYQGPWLGIVLGTLGFLGAIGGILLFFLRLLKEMHLNQAQSEFLASVSHALKTPIATLELSSSLLKSGDTSQAQLTPEERERLWISHNSELKRLKEQVDTLLEAARLQSHAVSIDRRFIVLETWISEQMVRWRQILGPQSTLTRDGPKLELEAHLDPKLLGVIIDNLIDNARKFARGKPEITLRTTFKDGNWKIAIIDQGWGFPPEDSERLFNRFFRSKTEAPYAIPGTGLGLFLAASAAKQLGLKITAQSDGVGKGASFTIEGTKV